MDVYLTLTKQIYKIETNLSSGFFSLKESKQTEQFKPPLYDSFNQFSSQDITVILAPKTRFLKVSFKLPIFFQTRVIDRTFQTMFFGMSFKVFSW